MRRMFVLALLLLAGTVGAREAPQSHCMDARRMQEAFQVGLRTFAIALDDGGRFRLDLADDCPEPPGHEGGAQVLAPAGWVCSDGIARIRRGAQACPIAAVESIDAKGYAKLLRRSRLDPDGVRTLDTVTVRGERRHGFLGSPNVCFSARHLRSWAEDGEGLIVEVLPRHSGGNRYYRVELVHSCPALTSSPGIVLRSGFGIGLICGNAGDRIELAPDNAPGAAAGFMGGIRSRQVVGRADCPIRAVYPVAQD